MIWRLIFFSSVNGQAIDGLIEEIHLTDQALQSAQLCFLTNLQADLLRRDPPSVDRLFERLGVKEPKIVFNMLQVGR